MSSTSENQLALPADTEPEELIKLGTITIQDKTNTAYAVEFDRIAIDQSGRLMILSVITDQIRIKQIRAMLAGGKGKVTIQPNGVIVARQNATGYKYTKGVSNLWGGSKAIVKSEAGYVSHPHKIGYGLAQALFISRSDGFIPVMDEVSLWRELKSDRYTTPIIREWTPYLMQKLTDLNYLKWCWSYRCQSATLECTSEQLDTIVSHGLRTGDIRIPDPTVIDAEFSECPKEQLALVQSA